jgi:tetratricopeptide (TPR) repeat protein
MLGCAVVVLLLGEGAAAAHQAFTAGEYGRAAALLESAIRSDPNDAALHFWLARSRYELEDYEGAAASAGRAVELGPDISEYHHWLGRALGERAAHVGWLSALGLAKRVRREFEKAVSLDPHNLKAQRDLIEFYAQAPGIVGGGRSKASHQAEVLSALDPVEGRLARAHLWKDEGRLDRALIEYRAVMQLRPRRAAAYLEVADFYEEIRDGPQLAEAAAAAAELDPNDPELAYARGVAAVLTGQDSEGERLLREYVASVPQRSDRHLHAAAREWLGRLFDRQGRTSAAIEEYRAALRLEPNRKGAQEALQRLGAP